MRVWGISGIVAAALFVVSYTTLPNISPLEYDSTPRVAVTEKEIEETETQIEQETTDPREVVEHEPLPTHVRAIYMTSCVAGTPTFRRSLVDLIEETEINSVVIDIKDYSGTISFPPESEAWQGAWQNARCGTRDMESFIAELHEKDIFVIGRITVFQDPYHAGVWPHLAVKKADGTTVWKDHKGLSFIDVAAQEYWDHIIELSVDSYNIGFDELNYDYVRYPSDGPMRDISFPHSEGGAYGGDKPANLEAFFAYLAKELDNEELFADVRHANTGRASSTPWTSVDLFGMTTTNHDDLSIGQVQERAAPYFDFVAPMVYPSHYPNSFLGLGNPNDHPYRVVHHAMSSGVARMTSSTTPVEGFLHEPIMTQNASGTESFTGLYKKPVYGADRFRTWIQDFDYGGDYDANDVRAEIQASYDAGVKSYMVWAPSNRYTKAAFEPATVADTGTTTERGQ